MVSQAARRRINTLSAHFNASLVTADDASAPPTTNLFPLNCGSNLSTPFIRRHDNRLLYGRQASASQGHFMRQQPPTPTEQDCSSISNTAFRRLDNRLQYGRQASAAQGYFMRQAAVTPIQHQGESAQSVVSCGSCNSEKKPIVSTTAPLPPPLYSRLKGTEPQFTRPEPEFLCSSNCVIDSLAHAKPVPAPQCSKFAKPAENITDEKNKLMNSKNPTVSSPTNGIEWSPRINVAEFKQNYAITVELPGVDIRDIRVEMDDKNLIVRGIRSMKLWKAPGCSNDSVATYHRREISQGQYQVVWPLPASANKDSISAEFMEGILQITIPKL